MSPIQTTVLIVALVTIVGVVISFLRKSSAMVGYDEIKAEVPRIASALRAELFRDGEDLVLTGNYKGRPAQVRFSYDENTPGLNILMQAPVSFTFSSVPKGARATEGRVLMRTGSDMFDAKFASRTDHPTQAKMLVGSRAVLQNIEKLCCSQKTYLTMTRGSIELSELVIPQSYTARHVIDHLDSMGVIAKAVEDIPGAETVKVVPYEREKTTPVFRIVLATAAMAAIVGVIFIRPAQPDLKAAAGPPLPTAEGVDPVEAARIADIGNWHAMRPEEYDPDVRDALRGAGFEPNGRFNIDLDGNDQRDVVYLLASDSGKYRLLVLKDGRPIYDTQLTSLAGALPVPKSSFDQIQWRTKPRATAESDGVLVLTRSNGELQPSAFFFSQGRVISGIPANWQSISFR
jgi:hypothetical protein